MREAQTTRLLEILTRVGVYGGLLMPLVYARVVSYPFVFLKMLYFQILVGVTFPAWIALVMREPKYRPRGSWLLWGVLAWFAAMAVSTLFAANPWRAFFGTQERMSGLFSLLHFLAWYLMVGSVLQLGRAWRRLLDAQLGVGLIAALVTLLQLKYPSLIGSTEAVEGERISGLLGNPIFAAAYQAFNVFFVIALWQPASLRRRFWYGSILIASLSSFVLAGSRGPLLGLLVGLVTMVSVRALMSRQRRALIPVAIGASVIVGIYGLVLLWVARDPSLESFWVRHNNLKHFFDFEIDLSRARLWAAGWNGFLVHPVSGWGVNGFEFAYDRVYRPEYHKLFNVDDPHNRLLGVLCETGILGLTTYLAMWGTFIAAVRRAWDREILPPVPAAALMGAAAGHFVQNLFAFDTPATFLTTFLVLAITTGMLASSQPTLARGSDWVSAVAKWLPGTAIAAVFGAVILLGSMLPGLAANYAKRAGTAVGQRDADAAMALLGRSHRLATPYREDQLLVATKGLLRLIRLKKFEDWTSRVAAMDLTERIAARHFESNNSLSRYRRAYANMLVAVGKLNRDPKMLQRAKSLLLQNLERSPRRQVYLFDFAKYEVDMGHLKEAEVLFRKALALNPAVGEANWELGKFLWTNLGRPEEGAKYMVASANGVDRFWPRKAFEWQQLAQANAKLGRLEGFGEIMDAVRRFPKTDRPTEVHLGIARYLESSGLVAQRDEVLRLARERNPAVASIVNPVLTGRATLADLRAKSVAAATQSRADSSIDDDSDDGIQGTRVSLARAH